MGWGYGPKPADLKKYLASELTWKKDGKELRCLDVAIVHARTAYAAVLRTGAVENKGVFAVVVLLDFSKKGELGEKWMDETAGPVMDRCPHRIYDLLTPLPAPVGDDIFRYARDWRKRVEKNFELDRQHREKLREGTVLVPAEGTYIQINPYGRFVRFRVEKEGRKTILYGGGYFFKASRWLVDKLKVAGDVE